MRFKRILGGMFAIAAAPGLLPAQDAIGPAWEIRVVERQDAVYGIVRAVVEDPSPAEVLRVQVELARHGHDPGVRSGVLDRPTRRALAAFQGDRGLVICSCLSYETVVALGIAPVVVAHEGDRRRAGYGSVYVYPPSGFPSSRFRGHRSTVFFGHHPGGVFIGHDPHGRRVERRPHRPSRPARPEPTHRGPQTRPERPDPPPEPRPGGRIRGAEPVRGSPPEDARPARPAGRITGPGEARPGDDRPARSAP